MKWGLVCVHVSISSTNTTRTIMTSSELIYLFLNMLSNISSTMSMSTREGTKKTSILHSKYRIWLTIKRLWWMLSFQWALKIIQKDTKVSSKKIGAPFHNYMLLFVRSKKCIIWNLWEEPDWMNKKKINMSSTY